MLRQTVLFLVAAAIAAAQTTVPFQLRIDSADNAFSVTNGSNVTVNADFIGQTVSLRLTALYRGTTRATILTPELLGSSDFTGNPGFQSGFEAQPNQNFTYELRFRPTTGNRVITQVSIPYQELAGPTATAPPPVGFITLTFSGVAPDPVVTYTFATNANTFSLSNGSALPFPNTLVNTISQASIGILNRGSGPGPITSIVLSGSSSFTLTGLPLLPGNLGAGSGFSFGIRYAPRALETATATLTIVFAAGQQFNIRLEASSINSSFAYEVLIGDDTRVVGSGETIALPDTAVTKTSVVGFRIRNTGTAEGQVTSLSLIGAGYQLQDPPTLPQQLAPNSAINFSIAVTPNEVGTLTGRLRIGNDTFTFSTKGTGPRLEYSFDAATGSPVPLQPSGSVLFTPVAVSGTSRVTFAIKNTGTIPANVINISIPERGAFTLTRVPTLPATLEPDSQVEFTIEFAPSALGVGGLSSLRIDNTTFNLVGSGLPPPPMPEFRFTGPTGNVNALEQPAIALALTQPYPLAITGVLTANVVAEDFAPDPAVQFSTGGRTVAFTIPANSTAAIFTNGANQIRLQTGSAAAAFTLSSAFATTAAGIDLTPANGATLRFTVPAAAPQLVTAQVVGRTSVGLTIQVNGYSTARALTQMDFQFATTTGSFTFAGTRFTVNVSNEAQAWFRNPSSQGFGGQFSVQVPFNLQSTGAVPGLPAGSSLLDLLTSVTITAGNSRGTSNALSLNLR